MEQAGMMLYQFSLVTGQALRPVLTVLFSLGALFISQEFVRLLFAELSSRLIAPRAEKAIKRRKSRQVYRQAVKRRIVTQLVVIRVQTRTAVRTHRVVRTVRTGGGSHV